MNRRSPSRFVPAVVLVLGLLFTACGGGKEAGGDARTASSTPQVTQAPATEGLSTVAQAKVSSVKVFARPGDAAATPTHTLANPAKSGAPLVLLVEKAEGDWMQVQLPVRPNGSTGWVRATDVTLTTHDYRIVVELAAFKITVFKGPNVVLSEPVGLGKGNTPTPGGKFYIKELLQPPNPNTVYGPYAYGLSGFSEALDSFAGGEAIIGIHGNNDPSTLGKTVSAGCIRMSNAGITKLARMLPLGVPVEIRK